MLKLIDKFFLIVALVSTGYLTWAVFLLSVGRERVCFIEPYSIISLLEFFMGFLTIVYLIYLIFFSGDKLE